MFFRILFLIVGFVVAFISCNKKYDVVLESETVKIGEEILKDVEIVISKEARVKTIINAPCLNRFKLVKNEDKGYTNRMDNVPVTSEFSCGIKIIFLDSLGKISNTVRADYAKYEEDIKNILLKNNIIIASQEGDTIWTESLLYDNDLKRFYTDSPILIKGPNHIIKGIGFESENNMENYKIFEITESQLMNFEIE